MGGGLPIACYTRGRRGSCDLYLYVIEPSPGNISHCLLKSLSTGENPWP